MKVKTRVNISPDRLNTDARVLKCYRVSLEMELIINSEVFRQMLIQTLEMRQFFRGERSKWKDASPEEIYLHILRGAEILSPEVDHKIDIVLDDFWSFRRILGYTKKHIELIYVNTRYFDKLSDKDAGSNLIHEYGHKLGFGHDFRNTKTRKDSICYILNDVYKMTHLVLIGVENGSID